MGSDESDTDDIRAGRSPRREFFEESRDGHWFRLTYIAATGFVDASANYTVPPMDNTRSLTRDDKAVKGMPLIWM